MGQQSRRYAYFSKQISEGEKSLTQNADISLAQLMHRAAQACLQRLQKQQRAPAQILILAGPGNNGGDGWTLARLAAQAGYQVKVYGVPPMTELSRVAAEAYQQHGGLAMELEQLHTSSFAQVDIVIDALFGIGLSRPLSGVYQTAIELLHQRHSGWLLAVDIPSGLHSDSGYPLGMAVVADATVTMIAYKAGLLTGKAGDYCGDLSVADLGVTEAFARCQQAPIEIIQTATVQAALPARARCSHKGHHGELVLIGGAQGMAGAMILAGVAALRTGVGKVTIACPAASASVIAQAQPELMVHAVDTVRDLQPLLDRADAIAIGPGLGQSKWAQEMLTAVAAQQQSLVVDADGLNLLAQQPQLHFASDMKVLTPHPGEAERLAEVLTEASQHRYDLAKQLADYYQAQVLLKGYGSIIASALSQRWQICDRGSPALATGGSGDVLTGVVGSLLAQGHGQQALPLAVWLHAVAAEQAAVDGERGTLASDLWAPLRRLVNPNFYHGSELL